MARSIVPTRVSQRRSRYPLRCVRRRSGSRSPRGTPVTSLTSASMIARARIRTPSRRTSTSPPALALRSISSRVMLSSAIVVFLLSSVSDFQRREDDAVAVLVHGLPAVTPSVGTRPAGAPASLTCDPVAAVHAHDRGPRGLTTPRLVRRPGDCAICGSSRRVSRRQAVELLLAPISGPREAPCRGTMPAATLRRRHEVAEDGPATGSGCAPTGSGSRTGVRLRLRADGLRLGVHPLLAEPRRDVEEVLAEGPHQLVGVAPPQGVENRQVQVGDPLGVGPGGD